MQSRWLSKHWHLQRWRCWTHRRHSAPAEVQDAATEVQDVEISNWNANPTGPVGYFEVEENVPQETQQSRRKKRRRHGHLPRPNRILTPATKAISCP